MKNKKQVVKVDDQEFELDSFSAVGIAEGFEQAESEDQVKAAWQYLINSDLAWQLQGFFGRTALDLIENGVVLSKADYKAVYA